MRLRLLRSSSHPIVSLASQVYLQVYDPPLPANVTLLAADDTVWPLAQPTVPGGYGNGIVHTTFPSLSLAPCSGGFSLKFKLSVGPVPTRDNVIAEGFSVGFVPTAAAPTFAPIAPLALGVGTGCAYVANVPAVHLVMDLCALVSLLVNASHFTL